MFFHCCSACSITTVLNKTKLQIEIRSQSWLSSKKWPYIIANNIDVTVVLILWSLLYIEVYKVMCLIVWELYRTRNDHCTVFSLKMMLLRVVMLQNIIEFSSYMWQWDRTHIVHQGMSHNYSYILEDQVKVYYHLYLYPLKTSPVVSTLNLC